jgi:hypothetical protein
MVKPPPGNQIKKKAKGEKIKKELHYLLRARTL